MLPLQVESFYTHWLKLRGGQEGYVYDHQLAPLGPLPKLELLPEVVGEERLHWLSKCALLKLNGGLATTMGLVGLPKSLVEVRPQWTFLDLVLRQLQGQRQLVEGPSLPLFFLDSFHTSQATREALAEGLRLEPQSEDWELMQSQVPRVAAKDLAPYTDPQDPESEWCPPGHGDLYLTLYLSGLIPKLLAGGYRYLFISNIDNLGATLDWRLPKFMAHTQAPMLMEVARRTPMDNKGGHLSRDRAGHLLLREASMCPPQERDSFGDIERYRYFNTNNLWLDLQALAHILARRRGLLPLPVICNRKEVGPKGARQAVWQLETACGSLISTWPQAQAIEVGRARFLPVKSAADLLLMRSDCFHLEEGVLKAYRAPFTPPLVKLAPEQSTLQGLEELCPQGVPSLRECQSLEIKRPVTLGAGVKCRGQVIIDLPAGTQIPAGALLEGVVDSVASKARV